MLDAAAWMAEKAKRMGRVAWRFAVAPGDAAPIPGRLTRAEAIDMVLAEDEMADARIPTGVVMSERMRVGVSVASLLCRAGIMSDMISLQRGTVRGLLDASLAGDQDGMYRHLNEIWDCLGLPPIEGPDTGNVLPMWPRKRDKKQGA